MVNLPIAMRIDTSSACGSGLSQYSTLKKGKHHEKPRMDRAQLNVPDLRVVVHLPGRGQCGFVLEQSVDGYQLPSLGCFNKGKPANC